MQKNATPTAYPPASRLRKRYMARLVGRCVIFLLCLLLFACNRTELDILQGFNFFRSPSVLHLLWGVWVIDMICQLMPVKDKIPLGSQKLFRHRFRPVREKVNAQSLKHYIVTTTTAAYQVMILWAALIAVIGVLYFKKRIGPEILFLITVLFYVCDLICVLIWCPFRLILKNRCCTTCRIFNWDHLMMFTPMIYIKGFYSISLLVLAVVVWMLWELCVILYPERFWEHSNQALRCSECTDKLCTQYCQKLRR